MKTSKSFKKVAKLATQIKDAKKEARKIVSEVDKERDMLDTLETTAKSIIKL